MFSPAKVGLSHAGTVVKHLIVRNNPVHPRNVSAEEGRHQQASYLAIHVGRKGVGERIGGNAAQGRS